MNAIQENGETALHIASRHGHLKIVYALLQDGADPTFLSKVNFSEIFYKQTHKMQPFPEWRERAAHCSEVLSAANCERAAEFPGEGQNQNRSRLHGELRQLGKMLGAPKATSNL